MPSVNLRISPQGPLIDVLVGVSTPRQVALTQAGQTVPANVQCSLLVDTGASNTCIDASIIHALALTPSGATTVHTPSTTATHMHTANQYDVRILIPSPHMTRNFDAIPVIETDLLHQGIAGLLGRDLLAHCLLVYNGELGIFTLSF
jgi:hypothetical protein